MKPIVFQALLYLSLLSSPGMCGKDPESINDESSKGIQRMSHSNGSFEKALTPFDSLIQMGRPGGYSPQGDHLGDLLKQDEDTQPLGDWMAENLRPTLKLSRGTTFRIPRGQGLRGDQGDLNTK